MLADYHIHSDFSRDSNMSVEEAVRKAIAIGLDEIAFTEHVDYGGKPGYTCDYKTYFETINEVQAKYAGQIKIKKGIEFGVQNHLLSLYERDFEQTAFDFVILSIHDIENQNLYDGVFQKGKTQDEVHQTYYDTVYEMIKSYKNYSVLGHLDLIKRYDKEGDYPDEKILPIIEKIFQMIIAEGKGIEVNTSSFKYGMKDLLPSRQILRLYYDMGGEMITIGSDAHDLEHLGDHIEEVKAILREIGFEKYCTFEEMQPVFHEL